MADVLKKLLRIKNIVKKYDCEEDKQNKYDCEEDIDCDQEIRTRICSKEFLEDIMRLILPRLCKSDYLSCRVVCHSWRAAVDNAIESKNCPPASRLPWLITIDSRKRFQAKDHCFVDQQLFKQSMGKLERLTAFVSFSRRKTVGSIEGWLIMVEHRAVYFLNPISGARVKLPSRHHTPFLFIKAVASTVPTRLQHCLVACLNRKHRLAFCKPTDKSWTLIEVEGRDQDELEFVDIEIIDQKLYAATDALTSESLMVFHISYADGGLPTYTAERLVMNHDHPRPARIELYEELHEDNGVPELNHIGERFPYLVKDSASKELFMIFHSLKIIQMPVANLAADQWVTKSCDTQGFRVFKLEGNTTDGHRWVEVVDLGDRILFLCTLGGKFISSGNGRRSCCCSDNKELERNCIYYAFSWRSEYYPVQLKSYCNFGVYSLPNRSMHVLPKHHVKSLYRKFTWFTPNPNLW